MVVDVKRALFVSSEGFGGDFTFSVFTPASKRLFSVSSAATRLFKSATILFSPVFDFAIGSAALLAALRLTLEISALIAFAREKRALLVGHGIVA